MAKYYSHADQLRTSLEYQKGQHRRSVETLGLSGNGDTITVAKKNTKVNARTQKDIDN